MGNGFYGEMLARRLVVRNQSPKLKRNAGGILPILQNTPGFLFAFLYNGWI